MSAESGHPGVEIDVMVTAEVPIPHAYVFRPEGGNRLTRLAAVMRPGAEAVRSSCLAYVVRHPSAGAILIDTGMHPDASKNLRQDFGWRMALAFRNLKPTEVPYEEQLRGFGVEPAETTRVVMTHLHVDHTSGMRVLPNARFTVALKEWAAATRSGAAGKGYVADHLPTEGRLDYIDFDTQGVAHGPFTKTVDLIGDGSIRLISTPGHTPGHMSVLLREATGRQVLVVGDAVYTLRSIRAEILPLLTASDRLYRDSLRQIKAFADANPDAAIVPSHDPTAWQSLRHASSPDAPAPGASR